MKQSPNEERVRQTNMLAIKQPCKQQNEGRIENREKTFVIYPNNNSLIWGDDIYDKTVYVSHILLSLIPMGWSWYAWNLCRFNRV